MFKFKTLKPKSIIFVGAYFRYNYPLSTVYDSGGTIYKLVKINEITNKITLAWYNSTSEEVTYLEDFRTIEEFYDYIKNNHYKIINESEIEEESLKTYIYEPVQV